MSHTNLLLLFLPSVVAKENGPASQDVVMASGTTVTMETGCTQSVAMASGTLPAVTMGTDPASDITMTMLTDTKMDTLLSDVKEEVAMDTSTSTEENKAKTFVSPGNHIK